MNIRATFLLLLTLQRQCESCRVPYLIHIGHLTRTSDDNTFYLTLDERLTDAVCRRDFFRATATEIVDRSGGFLATDLVVAPNSWNVYNHAHVYIRTN